MLARVVLLFVSGLCLHACNALTQEELLARLEAAGYSQIREIKSTAEGTSVKAMKNGKEVSIVVDSSGQIQERR